MSRYAAMILKVVFLHYWRLLMLINWNNCNKMGSSSSVYKELGVGGVPVQVPIGPVLENGLVAEHMPVYPEQYQGAFQQGTKSPKLLWEHSYIAANPSL